MILKPPQGLAHTGGVNTQVSAQKRSIDWTAALKNKPDIRDAAPSLLRMSGILLQTFLSWANFFTTAGQ